MGCSDGDLVSLTLEQLVRTIQVNLTAANLTVGDTLRADVVVSDSLGHPINFRTVTWTSLMPAVATVSQSGLIQGVQPGTATIRAAVGGMAGEADVMVLATPQELSVATVTVTPSASTRDVGATVQLTATTKDADGATLSGRVIAWATSNATVATVNASGLVTARAAGTASITASSEGKSGSATITVPQGPSSGDTIFYDGFESGTLSAWQDGVNSSVQRVVTDAAAAFAGSRSLEMTIPSGSTGSWISRFFMPGYDSVFVRFYIKFASDWTGYTYVPSLRGSRTDDQFSSFGTAGTCPAGNDWFATYLATQSGDPGHLEFYTYWTGMPREPNGTQCWGRYNSGSNTTYSSPPSMAKNRWYRVEFWVKLNTPAQSNGIQRFWVDGVLRGEWSGLKFRTTTDLRLNSLTLHAFGSGTSQARHLYYDEVLVSTTSPY